MPRQCCLEAPVSRRRPGRYSRLAASMLPAAVLLLLPKCPLCLAAWLTVATGVTFSASGAAWARAIILLVWLAVAAPVIWRRVFKRAPAFPHRVR
jgi:hypothetical protein